MIKNNLSYQVIPLGDEGVVIHFGNEVEESINKTIHSIFNKIKNDPPPFFIEAVPAYTTLTLFFNMPGVVAAYGIANSFSYLSGICEKLVHDYHPQVDSGRHIDIPVCYDASLAPDLVSTAVMKNLPVEELVSIHTAKTYRVYMLGFLPGFPYLGITDKRIHISRKPVPAQVAAGSVALAANQTGIYPFNSPGGWQVIGRTPLAMFRPNEPRFTCLLPGDTVQFYSISIHEYNDRKARSA